MKKVLLVAIVCCSVTLLGCFPPRENVQPSQRYIKTTGVIQKVDVRAGIEDLLVTAFAVKIPDSIYQDAFRYVALRGDRTAEIQPGAKIELVLDDSWRLSTEWTTVTDEKGFKQEAQLFYHAVTQYKILEPAPPPPPPKTKVETPQNNTTKETQ